MTQFTDKIALVTGASRGMGLATAKSLAAGGAHVITAQRGSADGFESIQVDSSQPSEVEGIIPEIIRRHGTIDVLINNAGVMVEEPIDAVTLPAWDRTLAVNLTAPMLLMRDAIKTMAPGSAIVNLGSVEGLANNPHHAAYGASKAGLHGLTRAAAVDAGPMGIRINAVAPGWIETDLNADFVANMPDPAAFREGLAGIHPIGRTGTPEEVANFICWLASDAASFVTGQIFTIDGGRTAKLSLP
ncbi:MAG: SDR family oxidoreductase [Pseudomonadota bacterium]